MEKHLLLIPAVVLGLGAALLPLGADDAQADGNYDCDDVVHGVSITVPCVDFTGINDHHEIRGSAKPLSQDGQIAIVFYGDDSRKLAAVQTAVTSLRQNGWPIGIVVANDVTGTGGALDILIDRSNVVPGDKKPPFNFSMHENLSQELAMAIVDQYQRYKAAVGGME